VFPKHIAEALKAGIKPDIEHKPDVCVLFTDILNFEQLQQSLTPVQLADLMDRYFSKIDTLVQDLKLYKVSETMYHVGLQSDLT
jgi:class 3 adenylate cyclase